VVVQNSYNLRGDRGLSDFDARHRIALSAVYELPFRANRFVAGWELAAIVVAQAGNPVNIVVPDSAINGVANTVRPEVTGPIAVIGHVNRWFDTSPFLSVPGLGNLGRNVVIGPGFFNADASLIRQINIGERIRPQFRAEFFDLLNHASFGPPGNVVGSPLFGQITRTRLATGESGSSRQLQFGVRFNF
jgi:hypothetical protein